MTTIKDVLQFSKELSLLYVEDNEELRSQATELFSTIFKHVDTAVDGLDGLRLYNENHYDVVITDINMPNMNGIEMIAEIHQINPEQKVVSISAHSESDILIDLIKAGIQNFIIKPVTHDELIKTLYPVCRDADTQRINIELVQQLHDEKEKLKEQNQLLQQQANTIETKHQQLETLLVKKERAKPEQTVPSQLKPSDKDAYFISDEDEGEENVVFLSDHADDLTEIFNEVPELAYQLSVHKNEDDVKKITKNLQKASTIFMHYTPYVDVISQSFQELADALQEHTDNFLTILEQTPKEVLMFFDAISSDMDRYIQRFQTESLAMKNSHHIHKPTALSIQQIIDLVNPEAADYGDMDFF